MIEVLPSSFGGEFRYPPAIVGNLQKFIFPSGILARLRHLFGFIGIAVGEDDHGIDYDQQSLVIALFLDILRCRALQSRFNTIAQSIKALFQNGFIVGVEVTDASILGNTS